MLDGQIEPAHGIDGRLGVVAFGEVGAADGEHARSFRGFRVRAIKPAVASLIRQPNTGFSAENRPTIIVYMRSRCKPLRGFPRRQFSVEILATHSDADGFAGSRVRYHIASFARLTRFPTTSRAKSKTEPRILYPKPVQHAHRPWCLLANWPPLRGECGFMLRRRCTWVGC